MQCFSPSNDHHERVDSALAVTHKLLEFVDNASDAIPVPGLGTAVGVLKSIIEAIQVGAFQCFLAQRLMSAIPQKTRGNEKSKESLLEKIEGLIEAIRSAHSMPKDDMQQLGEEQGKEVKDQMAESGDLQGQVRGLIGFVDYFY